MRDHIYRLMTEEASGRFAAPAKWCLGALAALYGLIMPAVRQRALKRAARAPVKVISVGNITVGGTGKTPLVIAIVKALRQDGRKVAVVTRGYKKKSSGRRSPVADEAAMLTAELGDVPVIIDATRLRGIRLAYDRYGVDTVVLDDAFQQWRLARDLDIVCVDARAPFGNGRLLPRGILREEPAALARADVCVISKADLPADADMLQQRLRRLNPRALIIRTRYRLREFRLLGKTAAGRLPPAALAGKQACVFSGIGDHRSFEELVAGAGISIAGRLRFDDHHWYTQADLQRIISCGGQSGAACFITTHKDAQRIEKSALSLGEHTVYVLMIETVIVNNEEAFRRRLRDIYTV